ncbi:MAG: DMT family transporter [Deltaproteobacteria bacterium]|nr:DMT family transporter [Deltaproteobacteria bacterium]
MKNLGYALITVVAWGLWAFLPKIATEYISPSSIMVYEVIAGLAVGLVLMYRLGGRLPIKGRGPAWAFVNGIIGYVGILLYLLAISKQDAIVVAPLSATYPITTLILGSVLLREKFRKLNYAGVFLALVAIYLILT